MLELIASFERVITNIRKNQCVWVQTDKGWYHCYNKEMVNARISLIRETIEKLNA